MRSKFFRSETCTIVTLDGNPYLKGVWGVSLNRNNNLWEGVLWVVGSIEIFSGIVSGAKLMVYRKAERITPQYFPRMAKGTNGELPILFRQDTVIQYNFNSYNAMEGFTYVGS